MRQFSTSGHSQAMKLYADTSVRRTVQLVGDVLLVLWVLLWISLAGKVRDATLELRAPGYKLDSSGSDLARRLRQAGDGVSGLPLVGDKTAKPFDGAGGAAEGLAEAGQAQVHAVETLAFWLWLAVLLIPIVLALVLYLPSRIRFVRRATAGQRFLDARADLDLFALRAMSRQPLHVLARIHDDPAGAWRNGDSDVIAALARVELRSVGLREPASIRERQRS
jgi:hypothetical protein